MKWKPRLRSVLLCINLSILVLPFAGIGVLRLFENALIQQTESELTAQAAFVAATFKTSLLRNYAQGTHSINDYAIKLDLDEDSVANQWRPQAPKIDLSSNIILPPPPEPISQPQAISPEVQTAGEEVTMIMRDAQQTTLAAIAVVDVNAIVVATTGEGLYQSLANREEVMAALNGEFQSILRERISDRPIPPLASISRGARIRVFQTMPVIHQGYLLGAVVLSRTPPNISQLFYKHRGVLMIAALILITLVIAITAISVVTLIGPVEAVTRQARQIARGVSGPFKSLKRPMTYEVSQLSNAMVQMAEHLEARARYIQDFAAQVSHAFKTPLTSIRGAVELLQDHEQTMPSQDRERFLNNLSKDSEYLQNLVQRLLELARADTIQAGHTSTLVLPLLEKTSERSRRLGLTVSIEKQTDDRPVCIADDILESILENLFDNARQHGADRVEVSVIFEFDASHERHVCKINVADNGKGVSAANTEAIFEPFFTTARHQGGSGLGLAVSRSLLAAHQGEIELKPSKSGAVFEVILLTIQH